MLAMLLLLLAGCVAFVVGMIGLTGTSALCSPSGLGWGVVIFALAALHFSLQQAVEILRVIAKALSKTTSREPDSR